MNILIFAYTDTIGLNSVNEMIFDVFLQTDPQVQPSESQLDAENSWDTTHPETMAQSQSSMLEQQQEQQQDEGHGLSQQDSNEGRSGVSSVSKDEPVDLGERKVRMNLLCQCFDGPLSLLSFDVLNALIIF